MLKLLARHPDTPCLALDRIEAELGPDARGALRLQYRMIGDADEVVARPLAAGEPPRRRDELWRHTCCELFVRDAAGDGYREYNFAPSGDWAAYRFEGYRAGMRPLEAAAPRIVLERSRAMLALTVTLEDQRFDALRGLRIAIASVVETSAGTSYWALVHPAARPDFHHSDAFALTLALAHTADCSR